MIPELRKVSPKNDPFRCAVDDPNSLLHPPADPYALLAPGKLIECGDIKRIADSSVWETIEGAEVGYEVPVKGIYYGRVEWPDMFRKVLPLETIEGTDMVWIDGIEGWSKADYVISAYGPDGDNFIGCEVSAAIAEMASKHGARLWIAKPDSTNPDSRAVPVPALHRVLWPREGIRRDDMVIYHGETEWRRVSEGIRNQEVIEACESNGWLRFCRGVDATSQSWYVDVTKGKIGNLGGADDPFASLDNATESIESTHKTAGIRVNGIIWGPDGVPLMIYDLPEPASQQMAPVPGEPVVFEAPVVPKALAIEVLEPEVPGKTDEMLPESSKAKIEASMNTLATAEWHVDSKIEAAAASIAEPHRGYKRDETPYSPIRSEAERTLPSGMRLMHWDEELKSDDIIFGNIRDNIHGWKIAWPDLFGLEVGASGYTCARSIAPTPVDPISICALRSHIAGVEKCIADLQKLLVSLKLECDGD